MDRNNDSFSRKAAEIQRHDAEAAAFYAPDYIEVKDGVRLYRCKIAHEWVITMLKNDPRYREILENSIEVCIVFAYVLAHDQQQTRNRLVRETRAGKIVDNAWLWLEKNELRPAEIEAAVTELAADITREQDAGENTAGEVSTPGGGAD